MSRYFYSDTTAAVVDDMPADARTRPTREACGVLVVLSCLLLWGMLTSLCKRLVTEGPERSTSHKKDHVKNMKSDTKPLVGPTMTKDALYPELTLNDAITDEAIDSRLPGTRATTKPAMPASSPPNTHSAFLNPLANESLRNSPTKPQLLHSKSQRVLERERHRSQGYTTVEDQGRKRYIKGALGALTEWEQGKRLHN